MEWSKDISRELKRQRRESFQRMWEHLPGYKEKQHVSEAYESLVRLNPLSLLEGIERRRRSLSQSVDSKQRATEEKLAKDKFAALLAGIIVEAKLPVVSHLAKVSKPEAVWARLFGTRRSKTLRNRYKSWMHFRNWLEVTHGKVWPTELNQLLDYSAERIGEGCGKTVLGSFQASLSVLEQTGRVPEASMLSKDVTWLSQLAAMTAELTAEQAPVKQAPMLTVAMVMALELYVVSEEEPSFLRAIAWVALLMVYCTLRLDDVQGLVPDSMTLTDAGFRAVLGRTKTTGADRRNYEVPVFLERSTTLTGAAWLEAGFSIVKSWAFSRDYLVPRAQKDWSGPTQHYAKPEELGLFIRQVYKRLGTPKFESGKFRTNGQRPLLPESAAVHFTGHSPRNWLPSVAATLGIGKDDRDFLGRWLIGGAGSAEYTRTARQIIHRVQITVCKAICSGIDYVYNEEEPLLSLKTFVDGHRQSGSLVARRHEVLKDDGSGRKHLQMAWPVFTPSKGSAGCSGASAAVHGDDEPEVVPDPARKYFISVSKRSGHRRLHLNGPCHVKPFHCRCVEFVDFPDLDSVDSVCKDCRQRMRAEQGVDEKEGSSSDTASSSTSSSSAGPPT